MNFTKKKVLIMGLGILGGGVSAVKWFARHKAIITVTDLKSRDELDSSIKSLGTLNKKIRLVLGKHEEEDFKTNDVIVVNPGVPKESKFLSIAKQAGKLLINDAYVFFNLSKNPIIAVTGTRGKTTTTTWIAHFLKDCWPKTAPAGNTPTNPLFDFITHALSKPDEPAVLELSSWQLEFLSKDVRAPLIAIITNLYEDHLNRYSGMNEYAKAKANIFKNQNSNQSLILNYDNKWTRFFIKEKPGAKIYFFSLKPLPKNTSGIFIKDNEIYFQDKNFTRKLIDKPLFEKFILSLGEHNIENLLASISACFLYGISERVITKRIPTLPIIKYREEVVLSKKNLIIVNDTASTMPEATIAALHRFSTRTIKSNLILISGGTDKGSHYDKFAKEVKNKLSIQNLFLLDGSATKKMAMEIRKLGVVKKLSIYENLESIIIEAKNRIPELDKNHPVIILLSPGAASFEKFKNEFDRGEQFNKLVDKYFK